MLSGLRVGLSKSIFEKGKLRACRQPLESQCGLSENLGLPLDMTSAIRAITAGDPSKNNRCRSASISPALLDNQPSPSETGNVIAASPGIRSLQVAL